MSPRSPEAGRPREGSDPAKLAVVLEYPAWVESIDWAQAFTTDEEKMALAIAIAQRNVHEGTGGPFGAAIFERDSGALLSVGMNLVVPRHNSTLHGEMVAFQLAEARLGTHSLGAPHHTELFTSAEPCAMCLGATLWSGVERLVTGATGDDARGVGFDEGPVFAESYAYLEARGVHVTRGVLRDEARAVLTRYKDGGGLIYNAAPGLTGGFNAR